MKKRIGILTLNGYYNYGNRLQNFALEKSIESLGFEVETIRVDRFVRMTKFDKLKSISSLKSVFKIINNKINPNNTEMISTKNRQLSFMKFTEKYIKESSFILSENNIPETISTDYDYFVVGSDQVWNPNNLHGTSFYFLTFARPEQRVSYSASFGISELAESEKENFTSLLNGMNRISVREEAGKKIVESLTNKKAEVLVDPTMLLDKDMWLGLAKKAKNRPNKKFILTYFLGSQNDKAKKFIDDELKKYNYEIINLADISDKITYETGPSEFIDYIYNAALFLTDSFHGVVFSIILQTPFVVFERESKGKSMYSRIETLLKKFAFTNREYAKLSGNYFYLDFDHTIEILENERNKSIKFLEESLPK